MSKPPVGARRCDVVVVGASAGGVQALATIAAGLPEDFGGAVLVALHLASGSSSLHEILARAGPLPAYVAEDGAPVRRGAITVAPPDRHLLIEDGHVRLLRGPKANGVRPSADVLFHSAAEVYGPRVAGVVLTGSLSDGTLGLRAIKRRDGIAIVQTDAVHQGMPTSAIENVDVDFELPLHEIAPRLTMLAGDDEETMGDDGRSRQTELEAGYDITELHEAPGGPSVLRCPDCGGALWKHVDGGVTGFSCHVGHTYSADSLLEEQGDAVERAIWTAVRTLEERAALVNCLAERMQRSGNTRSRGRFEEQARTAEQQARLIRRTLFELRAPGSGDGET